VTDYSILCTSVALSVQLERVQLERGLWFTARISLERQARYKKVEPLMAAPLATAWFIVVAQGRPTSQRTLPAFAMHSARRPSLRCATPSFVFVVLELEVLPLEGNGVVEEKLRSAFENVAGDIPGELLETLMRTKAVLLARA
jgi:hypothetical protein